MRELIGSGFYYDVYRVTVNNNSLPKVFKILHWPYLRTRKTFPGNAFYERARLDIDCLKQYFDPHCLLETKTRIGLNEHWWIEQEALPEGSCRVTSQTIRDINKSGLPEIAAVAARMKEETGFMLDWWGWEALDQRLIGAVLKDPQYWELPNLRLVGNGINDQGVIKIVDTGLLSIRPRPTNIFDYREPPFALAQEIALGIVGQRSGLRF